MRIFPMIIALALTHMAIAEQFVELSKGDERIDIAINGQPFAEYRTSRKFVKPFLDNVRAPNGKIVSRPIGVSGQDHPHHTGLFIGVDELNGIRFWFGSERIENVSVTLLNKTGNMASMKIVNEWLDRNRVPLLREDTVINVYPNPLLAYDITLAAVDSPVTIGDTEEGFLGFRMTDSMRELEGGQVVNADGLRSAAQCWGKTSNWTDYYGDVDGETCGVALFDNPKNFRPSRYHVRDYGLFSVSPFGEQSYTEGRLPASPVRLSPGETLRLRYGVYFHSGDTNASDLDNMHKRYVEQSR